MADGLIIKHPDTGVKIFDANTVTSHSRAAFDTSSTAGSLNISSLLRGAPFVIQALPTNAGLSYSVPKFTVSGSVVSWDSSAVGMRVLVGSKSVGGAGASASFDGFAVRRPQGSIQISTADQALQLSTWGSVTLTNDGQNHPQPMVLAEITVTGTNPVVAFRGAEGKNVNVRRIRSSGNGWVFSFMAQSYNPFGLSYWIFDSTNNAYLLNTNAGFILKDSSNVKTFDSRAFALNIVDNYVAPQKGTSTFSSGGRVYAAIQSTNSFINAMEDLGAYSNATNKPQVAEVGDPGSERPPNIRWSYMRLYSYQTTARAESNGGITVGETQFEQFTDWYSAQQPEVYNRYGESSHCIIDVTDFPNAPPPAVGELSVGVSSTSSQTTSSNASPITTVTPAITAQPTGQAGPYQYLWQWVSGSTEVVPNTSSDQASFATKVVNQPVNTSYGAVYRCRVTSANGTVGYSQDVSFLHTLGAPDYIPDTLNWTNASNTSNDQAVWADTNILTITGISAPITIQATISGRTGDNSNIQSSELEVWKNGSKVTGSVNSDNGSWAQVTVANGDQLMFRGYLVTSSGRKSISYNVTVTNQTSSGTQLDTFSIALVADDNNDYNVIDNIPNPITLNNQSAVSNENTAYTAGTFFQITGINTQITLRFTRDSLTQSGNVYTRRTHIGKSTDGGSTYTESTLGAAAGLYVDLTANNGDWFFIKGYLDTTSGRATGNWRNIVTNLTTGGVLGSAYVDMVVDNDNNYNVFDYDLDPIDWPNSNFVTNDSIGAASTGYKTMSGINAEIQLRVEISNITGSGFNLADGGNLIVNSASRGDLASTPWRNGGTFYVTVQPNEQIRFYCDAYTTQGIKKYGYDVNVYNNTTGAFIDHHYQSGTLDADNNYNYDLTPDPISITNFAPNSAAEVAYGTPRVFQVTGIQQSIFMRLSRTNSSTSANITLNQLKLRSSTSSSSGPWDDVGILYGNGDLNFTAINGMWFELTIEFRTNAGRGTGYYDANIYNLSTGATMATFNFNGVVDNDNNYNVVDYVPDSLNLQNQYITTNDNYGSANLVRYVTGINQTITIRCTVSNYSGNISGAGLYFHKNGTAINGYMAWQNGVDSRQTTFNNGDQISWYIDASTTSGRRQGQFYTEMLNVTTGQNLGGFWTYVDVDQNNDYNVGPVADYTPDPMSWYGIWNSTGSNTVWGDTNSPTVTGINQNITIRGTVSNSNGTGNGELEIWVNGSWAAGSGNLNNGSYAQATVANGSTVMFRTYITGNGYRYRTNDVSVTNQTTGAFLGSFSSSLTIGDNA